MSTTQTQLPARTEAKPSLYKFWRFGYQAGGDDYTGESAGGCVRWRRWFWRFYWRRNIAPARQPLTIPDGVTVSASRAAWGDGWYPVAVKGDETVCYADGKGLLMPTDVVAVEGRDLSADHFAERLRQMGFRFVWVGDPEEGS